MCICQQGKQSFQVADPVDSNKLCLHFALNTGSIEIYKDCLLQNIHMLTKTWRGACYLQGICLESYREADFLTKILNSSNDLPNNTRYGETGYWYRYLNVVSRPIPSSESSATIGLSLT